MTDVVMPQMGESIVEGTLTRWLKKPGDRVERDEPLFEISTDKVDTEIPSPSEGVLSEVLVQEGAIVAINAVVARIGDGAKTAEAPKQQSPAPAAQPAAAPRPEGAPRPEEKAERRSRQHRLPPHKLLPLQHRSRRSKPRARPSTDHYRPWFARWPANTTSIWRA